MGIQSQLISSQHTNTTKATKFVDGQKEWHCAIYTCKCPSVLCVHNIKIAIKWKKRRRRKKSDEDESTTSSIKSTKPTDATFAHLFRWSNRILCVFRENVYQIYSNHVDSNDDTLTQIVSTPMAKQCVLGLVWNWNGACPIDGIVALYSYNKWKYLWCTLWIGCYACANDCRWPFWIIWLAVFLRISYTNTPRTDCQKSLIYRSKTKQNKK